MAKKHLARLTDAVSAVCPISGVDEHGEFYPERTATDAQKLAARAAIDAFDDSDAAQVAWEEDKAPERKTLRQRVTPAIADLEAFLAIPTPSAAQVREQTQDICRYLIVVLKRLVQID